MDYVDIVSYGQDGAHFVLTPKGAGWLINNHLMPK